MYSGDVFLIYARVYVCLRGTKEEVVSLIAKGANVNEKHVNSYTPPHIASQSSTTEIVSISFD